MINRSNWVSNSSATSFCIFGISSNDVKLPDRFDEANEDGLDGWELALEELLNIDKRFVCRYLDDSKYLGIPFNRIEDDEMGSKFKNTAQAAITTVFGPEAKCVEIEEASYNG